jgi:hypothetical protein
MEKTAIISECGQYRYQLGRAWDDGPIARFIMLNPSTADATEDDPTIRRCISFAKREGAGAISVVNLFAFRATKPIDMMKADDPIGPENNDHLREWVGHEFGFAKIVIAAWGANHMATKRFNQICARGVIDTRYWQCLGKTKSGAPGHPLYIKGDAPLINLHE